MREILFRGKVADAENAWVKGYLIKTTSGRYRIAAYCGIDYSFEYGHDYNLINDYEVIPDTLGQFTGILDKRNSRVFEGDTLEICTNKIDETGVVLYNLKKGMFECSNKKILLSNKNIEIVNPKNL